VDIHLTSNKDDVILVKNLDMLKGCIANTANPGIALLDGNFG